VRLELRDEVVEVGDAPVGGARPRLLFPPLAYAPVAHFLFFSGANGTGKKTKKTKKRRQCAFWTV
jgi:hypothetical protein